MRLNLAKLIEQRKRSRIERARQLSSNIETQSHILRQTELFNLAAEYQKLASFLKPFGQNVPVVEKACFDAMKGRLENLEQKNNRSIGNNNPMLVSRPLPQFRSANPNVPQVKSKMRGKLDPTQTNLFGIATNPYSLTTRGSL